MKIFLFIIGFVPLALGGLLDSLVLQNGFAPPYIEALSGIFLLLWGLAAFAAKRRVKSTKLVVILLNSAAAVMLILNILQLVRGAYWQGPAGLWNQLFFLPALPVGLTLAHWGDTMLFPYIAAFLAMAGVSALGCKLQKK